MPDKMRTLICLLLPVFFSPALFLLSCGGDSKHQRVEFEQIEIDGSTNDRYLFREELQKERERKKRGKKKEDF